jgi:hypothetical protein
MPPKLTKAQQTLFEWEYRVAAMGIFDMHESYDVSDVLDKNVRFTGFLEQRVAKMISMTNSISPFCNLNIERDRSTGYWWNTAIDIAEGDEPKSALPRIINPSKADKRVVYGELIPAYRALKDSFEKRWWFEWLFNHKQYVTERDSIKALKGVMMALTGDDAEVIDRELEEHRDSVPTSGVTPEERKAMIREVKDQKIHEIKRLKVIKWIEKNQNFLSDSQINNDFGEPIDDEMGNLEWNEIYQEIVSAPAIDDKGKEEIIEGVFDFDEEISENGDVEKNPILESNEDEKVRVIFENGEFALPDKFEIQKPVGEKDEFFIENIEELGIPSKMDPFRSTK